MRILILGGNGFIGSAVAQRLAGAGHDIVALARDAAAASRRMPALAWRQADLAAMTRASAWTGWLDGVEAVVNCAGVLQDGARDHVDAVQRQAMLALYAAAATARPLIVQISARTEGAASATPFLATKRQADAALKASGLAHVILRPAVVVGRNAHGGTALLRMLAGFPGLTPLVHADAGMQFAALDDVADAALDAIEGRVAPGADIDIAHPEVLTLAQAVAAHRAWLGLPPARRVDVPDGLARIAARVADGLGALGWRSPLRSTALVAASGGVRAESSALSGRWRGLHETLALHPAGVQDVWFARLYLLKPLLIGTLSLFWLVSGFVALARLDAAAALLVDAGLPAAAAGPLAVLTALADIALGLLVLARRTAALALLGMVAVSLAYLAAATLLSPHLWADPLGPLVKVVPAIVLALAARAVLDER